MKLPRRVDRGISLLSTPIRKRDPVTFPGERAVGIPTVVGCKRVLNFFDENISESPRGVWICAGSRVCAYLAGETPGEEVFANWGGCGGDYCRGEEEGVGEGNFSVEVE